MGAPGGRYEPSAERPEGAAKAPPQRSAASKVRGAPGWASECADPSAVLHWSCSHSSVSARPLPRDSRKAWSTVGSRLRPGLAEVLDRHYPTARHSPAHTIPRIGRSRRSPNTTVIPWRARECCLPMGRARARASAARIDAIHTPMAVGRGHALRGGERLCRTPYPQAIEACHAPSELYIAVAVATRGPVPAACRRQAQSGADSPGQRRAGVTGPAWVKIELERSWREPISVVGRHRVSTMRVDGEDVEIPAVDPIVEVAGGAS